LEEIGTLLELAGEINPKLASQHSGNNAPQLIRTECTRLWKLLTKTEIEIGKVSSGNATGKIRLLTRELARRIEKVEEIVASVANGFDKTHTCNLSEAVASEVAEYQSRFLESSPSLEITADLPEANNGAFTGIISGDDLRQVLEIIIQNSIESLSTMTGTGRKRITLRLSRKDSTLELAVEDTGPGISHNAAEKIFDKGFSTKAGKRGLGLALARDTLRMYGGDLKFDSTFSGGARLIAVVPKALELVI
jgi:signal transduction histidine kinase